MIDPISVSSLAITLIGICSSVVNGIKALQTTDAWIETFVTEISGLSRILLSLRGQLDEPLVRRRVLSANTDYTNQYWQHVKRSMYDCGRTIESLHSILQDVTGSPKRGVCIPFRKGTKLGKKKEILEMYMRQIKLHREALNLATQLIAVYLPSLLYPLC
jgi:hypothetical protein